MYMPEVDDVFDATLPQSCKSSIRECSRRLLSGSNIHFYLHANYLEEFHKLILSISDINPALAFTIEDSDSDVKDSINVSIDGTESFQLGGFEPEDTTVCWAMGNLDKIWKYFKENCIDLAMAGYPGCEGCVDDKLSENWSEISNRNLMKKSS